MTLAMVEGVRRGAVPCNVVVYDPESGEIVQTAHLRPSRIAGFAFPGPFLYLWTPRAVDAEAERVDPDRLEIVPRPVSPLAGLNGAAPLSVDLSGCPDGSRLILHNEDGDTLEAQLPLAEGVLVLRDPGRYVASLRGAFPYQDFIGEIEVANG